jgi:hypothetical protein
MHAFYVSLTLRFAAHFAHHAPIPNLYVRSPLAFDETRMILFNFTDLAFHNAALTMPPYAIIGPFAACAL